MNFEKSGCSNDFSDNETQKLSWSTEDSLTRFSSCEILEDSNEIEEKITQYLAQLRVQFFTNPSMKEEQYQLDQKRKIFQKNVTLQNAHKSNLIRKRSMLFLK